MTVENQMVSLGTAELRQEIAGVQLSFPVNLGLALTTSSDGVLVNLNAAVGLGALQSSFNDIARRFPIPNDMSGYGTKFHLTVDSAALESAGDMATLKANVNVEVWQIEKGAPGGGTTIRWETRCVDIFGKKICTDVPVEVEIKPGDDIKARLFSEGVACQVSMSLATPDGKSIEVRPSAPSATPRGDIGKFINDILGLFNANLAALAQRELAEIVNDGTLRKTLPQEIEAFNPVIRSVQFDTGTDGALGVRVGFQATLTPEQLTEWMKRSLESVEQAA